MWYNKPELFKAELSQMSSHGFLAELRRRYKLTLTLARSCVELGIEASCLVQSGALAVRGSLTLYPFLIRSVLNNFTFIFTLSVQHFINCVDIAIPANKTEQAFIRIKGVDAKFREASARLSLSEKAKPKMYKWSHSPLRARLRPEAFVRRKTEAPSPHGPKQQASGAKSF